ncbi:MAG: LysR family transcriptional regulator [Carbonactinosporaceae bacterium]
MAVSITLTQLRTYLVVAETGSVRATAERLVVTQSAVSAALAGLQRSLGVALTRPRGRGLALTEAGEVYARHVRTALGLLEQARVAAAGEVDPERGQLRLAAVTTAGEQILPGLLAGFRRSHPQAGLLLEVGNRARVWELLDGHEVDLVLGGRPAPGRNLVVHAMRPNELVVLAPPELGRAATRPIVSWLGEQHWLLREPGSGTRETTGALLAGLELAPRTLTVGSNVAVRESVVAGLGVTLMSRDAAARELAEGTLVEVATPLTPLHRDWCVVAHPGRLPATAALFLAHLLETAFHPPSGAP